MTLQPAQQSRLDSASLPQQGWQSGGTKVVQGARAPTGRQHQHPQLCHQRFLDLFPTWNRRVCVRTRVSRLSMLHQGAKERTERALIDPKRSHHEWLLRPDKTDSDSSASSASPVVIRLEPRALRAACWARTCAALEIFPYTGATAAWYSSSASRPLWLRVRDRFFDSIDRDRLVLLSA